MKNAARWPVVLLREAQKFRARYFVRRTLVKDSLAESEEKFRLLFENSPDPILLLDKDVFIDCNKAALKLIRASRKEDIIGLHPWELSPERQPGGNLSSVRAREILNAAPQGNITRFEWTHQSLDGEDLCVEVSLQAIPLGRKQIVYNMWSDIRERKLAEKELKESEERYRVAITHSNDGVILIVGGYPVVVNQRLLDIFGYRSEEIQGDLCIGVHPDDRERIMEYAARRNRGEWAPPRYEFKGVRKDGTLIHIEASVAKTTYQGRPASLAYLRDVTERKEAEETLRRAEEKYRNIFENAMEGIFQSRPEGYFLSVNPAFLRMFGYTSLDELLTSVKDIGGQLNVRTEDREEFMRLVGERGSVEAFEFEAFRRDGRKIWVSMNAHAVRGEQGEILHYEGTMQDITARKQTEKALRESEEKYRSIFENAVEGIFRSTPQGRIVGVNPALAAIHGYDSPEEMLEEVRRKGEESLWVDKEARTHHWDTLKKADVLRIPAAEQYRKDGSICWTSITAHAIRDAEGRLLCYEGMIEDITGRRRLEEQLRQSQKMEAIGTLAGGIAHDFNNMLAIIMGNAELALDDVDKPEPRRNLEAILGASKRSRDLVRQILTFSRKSVGEVRAVDMRSLLEETHALLRSSLPSMIKIQFDLRTAPGTTVMGEASKIQQIVLNLANNAAHAMREKGGTLVIGLSTVTLGTDSPSDARMSGPHVKLTIKDTGTGIAPEVRTRMFEPFFTTKGPGQGTGMGLAVVYGIVEDLNGMIEVESEVGTGTTFSVVLPQAPITAKDQPEDQASAVSGREHILLVDDEAGFVAVTASMLERFGYRVTSATDSLEAMRLFSESPQSFDLILTDQTMPDLTGIELARKAQSIRRGIPIILCTGYSEIVSEETAKQAGIRDFVMKPIRKKQMAQAIRRALDNKKTRRSVEQTRLQS